MAHSFNKIWIHAIWATKYRMPLIETKIESQVYEYLRTEFIDTGCPVKIINGMPDHVHCLFLMNPKKAITDILKQVKGSTSHSINEQNFTEDKFLWQTGYAAFSVSDPEMEKVFNYIRNQKTQHAKKTFAEEYAEYLKFYGFDPGDDESAIKS